MNSPGKNQTSFIGASSGSKTSKNTIFRSGCLYPLLGFLIIYGFYVFVLRLLLPDPMVPFFFGLFTAIGTGALLTGLLGLLRSRKLGAAIRRDREGAPRKDGRFEAVGGTIHPLQEALASPFQGLPCVAYEYDVAATGKDNHTAGSDAWGWALTPSVIRTAGGDQRLLGFPELEKFDQAVIGEGGRERIKNYFQNTNFEGIGERALGKALGQILERSVDDDGQARTDILRGSGLNPQDLRFDGRQWTERVVPVGEEVTAFGSYSSARGGLVPHPRRASETVQLWPGKGEGLTAVMEKESSSRLALGIVVFILTHAFVSTAFFIMWLKGYYD
ncbi:MAG: hypothetical protein HY892_16190 [Deltaproteobacteria bacterium]|nr:hypothetical protein [Deltaproteobacteria bacterium]